MDLLVWYIDQNGGSSHGLDLAKVLGDVRLLQAWRQANDKDVSKPSFPATMYLCSLYSQCSQLFPSDVAHTY